MPQSAAEHRTGRDWLTLAVDPFNDGAPMVQPMPIPPESNVATQVFSRIFTITKPAGLPAGDKWDCHIFTLPVLHGPTFPLDFSSLGLPDTFDPFARAYPCLALGGTMFEMKEGSSGATMPAAGRPSTLNWIRVKSGYPTMPAGTGADLIQGGFSASTHWRYMRNINGVPLTDECNRIGAEPDSSYFSWNGIDALPEGENSPGYAILDAGGYEVHDETPELYKSGGVTCYVMANQTEVPVSWDHLSTKVPEGQFGSSDMYNVSMTRQPPATVEEAALIHGSVTWDAEDGVYQPFRLRPRDAHCQPTFNSNLYLTRRDLIDYSIKRPLPLAVPAEYQPGICGWTERTYTTGGGPVSAPMPGVVKNAAIETTGSYFTGLHETTVLKLVVRFIVTTRPTPESQLLTSFAKPPPPHDLKAISSYCETVANLPPAVPVGENPAGEFLALAKGALASASAGFATASGLASKVASLTNQVQSMRLQTVANKTPMLQTKITNAQLKQELVKVRQGTKTAKKESKALRSAKQQAARASVGPRGKV
nr:MAG: peptidase A21 family protein [Chemarfal virus 136]